MMIQKADQKPSLLFIHVGSGLGDAMMASLSLELLKSSLPDWEICVISKNHVQNYFESLPYVDRTFSFVPNKWLDKKLHTLPIALLLYLKLLWWLKNSNFQATIQWRATLIDTLIGFSTGAPLRVAPAYEATKNSSLRKIRAMVTELIHIDDNARSHMVEFMQNLAGKTVEKLGSTVRPAQNQALYFPFSENDTCAVSEWLLTNNVQSEQSIAAISVGSRTYSNRWLPKNFSQVADYLQSELKIGVVLTGLSSQIPLEEEIVDCMTTVPIRSCGQLSLGQLAALYRRCCLVVALNTASMHVAAATNTPIVVLLGRDGSFFAPWQTEYVAVTKNPYYPRRHPDPKQWPKLVNSIEPEEVNEAIEKLLGRIDKRNKRYVI